MNYFILFNPYPTFNSNSKEIQLFLSPYAAFPQMPLSIDADGYKTAYNLQWPFTNTI